MTNYLNQMETVQNEYEEKMESLLESALNETRDLLVEYKSNNDDKVADEIEDMREVVTELGKFKGALYGSKKFNKMFREIMD